MILDISIIEPSQVKSASSSTYRAIWGKYILTLFYFISTAVACYGKFVILKCFYFCYLRMCVSLADFCMPINADHNSNRLKSHLLPPVSNDCKFSLFYFFFFFTSCDISQMQSHIWIAFLLQFLRLHVYHMRIFFVSLFKQIFLVVAPQRKPQSGILSSSNINPDI